MNCSLRRSSEETGLGDYIEIRGFLLLQAAEHSLVKPVRVVVVHR
jgi:hypothetical protein